MHKASVLFSGIVLAVVSLNVSGPTQAQTPAAAAPACAAPNEYTRLEQPLLRTALSLASGEPVVIVAVGSSSTAGAGASSPAASYPNRLEADLRARFPGIPITVLNRGVNGEEAKQMLARFDETVISEKPDLVLWQVGTNAVLRDHKLANEAPLIREGIRRLKAVHADVILLDSQYAPKVIAKPDAPGMVDLIRAEAREEKVSVFHRWDIMRHWHDVDGVSFESLLSPDGLHMNDWSYGCIAKLLSAAIADAARSPAMARVPSRR
jgi:lysophospholipase L1-like esterase